MYSLIVDQASFCNPIISAQILWVSVALAIFVVIQGFMLNLVSTDLIAEVSPPRINTIEDLSTPHSESVGIKIL